MRAGATYYSDEFAVFDARGRVHPFPTALSIRDGTNGKPRRCAPEALGGRSGVAPLPVGLVVVTTYRAGAAFTPPTRLQTSTGSLWPWTDTGPVTERLSD